MILESLSLVSSSVKALSLLPSIKNIPAHEGDAALARLLVSSIDGTSVEQMNDPEGEIWEVYLRLLKKYLHPSSASGLREVLIRLLGAEIFDKLEYEKQIVVCKTVIEVVAREPDAVSTTMGINRCMLMTDFYSTRTARNFCRIRPRTFRFLSRC